MDVTPARNVVMIAIDGSDNAELAFDFYTSNLNVDGNELLLVHCAEPPVQPLHTGGSDVWETMLEEEHQRVKDLEDKYSIMMSTRQVNGKIMAIFTTKPGETLCKIAEAEGCSLIVMGCRGLGLVRRTLLGSVSEFVLHHAHCPVMVCRL